MAHVIYNNTEYSMLFEIRQKADKMMAYAPLYTCSECGGEVSHYNAFCPMCGASFDTEFWYTNPQGKDIGKAIVKDDSTIEERREMFFKCMEKIATKLDLGLHFDMVPTQKED